MNHAPLFDALENEPLKPWLEWLPAELTRRYAIDAHGDMPRWRDTLAALPGIKARHVELDKATVVIGDEHECDSTVRNDIETILRSFHPWRKGPFSIFGVHIDTEWRSDWKWSRLESAISPLHDRAVLDVGCGSGYHCLRMRGAGARLVLGIEPVLLYNLQFRALSHFVDGLNTFVLPFALEQLNELLPVFDSVFSMGVLYHRRAPFDHLYELKACLRPGGELILETLVVDGDSQNVLVPEDRYAKMRNVWFIPSTDALLQWLTRAGFVDARLIDVSPTTVQEQRTTSWMHFESLANFLDPHDPSRTVEGYPAPRRAIVIATKPG